MALSVTTDERLPAAVAYLREAGHEEEARAVEELLAARPLPTRGRPSPPGRELVSIAEAAERLGEPPEQVRRRIELGMLTMAGEGEAADHFVTRESLEALLDNQRGLAIIADFPHSFDEEGEDGGSTLVSQMLASAHDRDERS